MAISGTLTDYITSGERRSGGFKLTWSTTQSVSKKETYLTMSLYLVAAPGNGLVRNGTRFNAGIKQYSPSGQQVDDFGKYDFIGVPGYGSGYDIVFNTNNAANGSSGFNESELLMYRGEWYGRIGNGSWESSIAYDLTDGTLDFSSFSNQELDDFMEDMLLFRRTYTIPHSSTNTSSVPGGYCYNPVGTSYKLYAKVTFANGSVFPVFDNSETKYKMWGDTSDDNLSFEIPFDLDVEPIKSRTIDLQISIPEISPTTVSLYAIRDGKKIKIQNGSQIDRYDVLSFSAKTSSPLYEINRVSIHSSNVSPNKIFFSTFYGEDPKNERYTELTFLEQYEIKLSDIQDMPLDQITLICEADVIPAKIISVSDNPKIMDTIEIKLQQKNVSNPFSLEYHFGNLSGFVGANGNTSNVIYKMTSSPHTFNIPEDFYTQIPNSTSGKCEIICTTYKGASGNVAVSRQTHFSFDVSINKSISKPVIITESNYSSVKPSWFPSNPDGWYTSITDNNDITKEITNDKSVIIQNASTARCTFVAKAVNSAKIKTVTVNGYKFPSSQAEYYKNDGTMVSDSNTLNHIYVNARKYFKNVDISHFEFKVEDSRGLISEYTIDINSEKFINYTPLKVNKVQSHRPYQGGDLITLSTEGICYNGNFKRLENGRYVDYANTLELTYVYHNMNTLEPTSEKKYLYPSPSGIQTIGFGRNNTFRSVNIDAEEDDGQIRLTPSSIVDSREIEGETVVQFDYKTPYTFVLTYTDGINVTVNGITSRIVLNTITYIANVNPGIPVFDWGEKDFNFNVPVSLSNINIIDYIFPVGSLYLSVNNTIPDNIKFTYDINGDPIEINWELSTVEQSEMLSGQPLCVWKRLPNNIDS